MAFRRAGRGVFFCFFDGSEEPVIFVQVNEVRENLDGRNSIVIGIFLS